MPCRAVADGAQSRHGSQASVNRSPGQQATVIGRASTTGGPTSIEAADPIEPARAVRRALADAGCKAFEIDTVVVGAASVIPDPALRRFARRALGPRGDDVVIRQHVSATGGAEALATVALATLSDNPGHGRLWIVVGLAADGSTVALCARTRLDATRQVRG